MATTMKTPTCLRALGVASALLFLAGCASVPPPTDLMQRAQQQLQGARDAHAEDYAPVDLTFAEQRFKSAQAAMQAKKYALARDMAEESRADAHLARVRADLAVARKEIKTRNAENQRLRQQLLEPAKSAPAKPAAAASRNAGLPDEIMLPQPQEPASAQSGGHPADVPAAQGDQP